MEIGFIGLGNMGFPIARRLVEAQHDLTVYDTRAEVVESLVRFGARAASSTVTSQVSAGSQGRPSASMTRVSKKCLPCFAAVER